MKRNKILSLMQVRRDAWAKKLQPMHSMPKCCLKECISSGIPIQLLIQKRKVSVTLLYVLFVQHKRLHVQLLHRNNQDFLCFNDQCDRKQSLLNMRDSNSRSGFSIVEGLYPICWKGLHSLLGVSTALLQSVQGTPHAKAGPVARRPSRVGLPSKSFSLNIQIPMPCSSCNSCLFCSLLTFSQSTNIYKSRDCGLLVDDSGIST